MVPTCLCDEWLGSCPGKRLRNGRQHHKVSVKCATLKSRERSGVKPYSFLNRPSSRSIGARPPDVCGTSFTTRTGNSSQPPDTVPSYMGVVVASSVTQSGSTISGTWGSVVVVRTDPGYAPNPGHPGTGTIVATLC